MLIIENTRFKTPKRVFKFFRLEFFSSCKVSCRVTCIKIRDNHRKIAL